MESEGKGLKRNNKENIWLRKSSKHRLDENYNIESVV